MPHIHLDAPLKAFDGLDIQSILDDLVRTLSNADTVNPCSVKAYASVRDHFSLGEGHSPFFVHCQVSLLGGRPLELRQRIGREIRQTLERHWGSPECTFTIEVREMDPETYLK